MLCVNLILNKQKKLEAKEDPDLKDIVKKQEILDRLVKANCDNIKKVEHEIEKIYKTT